MRTATPALFLGAFLLFLVQPLVAKAVLPSFGGSAGVWTTCALFFQVALCAGYAYAHALVAWVPARAQGWIHALLLALSASILPLDVDASAAARASSGPTWAILGLLVRDLTLPFVLLASSVPLLSAWRARGPLPYRLYTLSNLAAIAALLAYPVVVEPNASLPEQSRWWSTAYVVFAVLSATCGLWKPGPVPREGEERSPGVRPGVATVVFWFLLAACGSTLLLAVTNHMAQEVASSPFLWVLPLALYLLSFVLCFDGDRWYRRARFATLLAPALGAMTVVICLGLVVGVRWSLLLLSAGLFVCCMACHGELAASRPAPRHLTGFYLVCAVGGAAGGVFVGLLAPRWFDGLLELAIGMVGCAALAIWAAVRDTRAPRGGARARRAALSAAGCGMALMGALLWLHAEGPTTSDRLRGRNFYGTVRVYDVPAAGGRDELRTLILGNTVHGLQFVGGERTREAISYFGPLSGIALVLGREVGRQRVCVIGLGAGTVASFGNNGDEYVFYEINPLVESCARSEFSYLDDSAASCEVVLGDGRLLLEAGGGGRFDVLVLDALTGNAVPTHLLTIEAFRSYFRSLGPDGLLVVNVTNRYLDLGPIVSAAAHELGKGVVRIDSPGDAPNGLYPAHWIVVTSDAGFLRDEEVMRRASPAPSVARRAAWTDQESSLLGIVR